MPTTERPTIRIHNSETNEVIDREMNDIEFKQYQDEQASIAAKKNASEAAANAKTALLEKLGITAEEAKLLLA
jgi:ribosomal protein S11